MRNPSIFLISILLFALPTALATDHAVISEVLFWANGTDTGGEFVELYNPTTIDINISGWAIATESSETDATIPQGSVLLAHHFYLVADAGWDNAKDKADWPSADHEETITLANSDSGVALMRGSEIIDATGWGDPNNIEDGKYEGAPFPTTLKGSSIERRPGSEDPEAGNGQDTDDNAMDFLLGMPEPQNSQDEETPFVPDHVGNLSIIFNVAGNEPGFLTVSIEDDSPETGIQLIPSPGEQREVYVNTTVSHAYPGLGVSTTFLNQSSNLTLENLNGSVGYYSGTVSLPFYTSPGNNTLILTANNVSRHETTQIMEVAALSLDSATVQLDAEPGENIILWGDETLSTGDKPTIQNIGNTPLDLKARGTPYRKGDTQYPPSISAYNLNLTHTFLPLSEQWQTTAIDLDPGEESYAPLSIQLQVPSDANSGSYAGSMLIAGVATS